MDDIYYMKKFTCPVCENAFSSTKIKSSKLIPLKTDTDMCTYYKGLNPYFYEINVCPKCGFAFSDHFKHELRVNDKSSFLKIFSSRWKKQDLCGIRTFDQAVDAFEIAILSGQIVNLNPGKMAVICLRLSWIYRMQNKKDDERRFMKSAVDLLEKAYEVGGIDDDEDISPEILVYLLGELNFRLRNRNETVKWFNIAISRYSKDPSVKKRISNMISDRWLEIKDNFK
ncbi:MAG TPA: hypothetical protein DD426_11965 [Clostridiaceae bacterium]|nr:hypothetical protein [Clostridiaceae bacterium]